MSLEQVKARLGDAVGATPSHLLTEVDPDDLRALLSHVERVEEALEDTDFALCLLAEGVMRDWTSQKTIDEANRIQHTIRAAKTSISDGVGG